MWSFFQEAKQDVVLRVFYALSEKKQQCCYVDAAVQSVTAVKYLPWDAPNLRYPSLYTPITLTYSYYGHFKKVNLFCVQSMV